MLILILIDAHYLQNVVFSFEKGSNGQNHFFSDSHKLIKIFPQTKFPIPPTGGNAPYPLRLFGKPCIIFNILYNTF